MGRRIKIDNGSLEDVKHLCASVPVRQEGFQKDAELTCASSWREVCLSDTLLEDWDFEHSPTHTDTQHTESRICVNLGRQM